VWPFWLLPARSVAWHDQHQCRSASRAAGSHCQLTLPETVIIAPWKPWCSACGGPSAARSRCRCSSMWPRGPELRLACFGCRLLQSTLFADSLAVNLPVATAICYLANTIAVSTALCLVERKPASAILRRATSGRSPTIWWKPAPPVLCRHQRGSLMATLAADFAHDGAGHSSPTGSHVTRAVAPR